MSLADELNWQSATELARLIRLHASRKTVLYNGALECRLYEFKLVAGSMRREKSVKGEQ